MTTVRLSSRAEKSYEWLTRSDRRLLERVDRALDDLVEHPDAGKPLHGTLSALRSLRVGPLRIVYRWEVDRLLVLVLAIGQRGEVYRDLKG